MNEISQEKGNEEKENGSCGAGGAGPDRPVRTAFSPAALGPSRQSSAMTPVPTEGLLESTTSAVHVVVARSTAAQGSADSEGGVVSVPRPDEHHEGEVSSALTTRGVGSDESPSSSPFNSGATLQTQKEGGTPPVAPAASSLGNPRESSEDGGDGRPLGFFISTADEAEIAVSEILSQADELERRSQVLDNMERAHKQRRAFLESALADYYDEHPPKRGKTLHLGNGDLGRRLVGGGLSIDDPERLKAWAREHLPAAVVGSFVESLDNEIARREIEAKYFRDMGVAFAAALNTLDNEAAFEAAKAAARASLPPGTSMRETVDKFYVAPPRARKGK